MGMFDNLKMAREMMKNMSPEQMQDMMAQAKGAQAQMEEIVKKAVAEEIKRLDLVSRDEIRKILQK